MTSPLHRAALGYARAGFEVLPLTPGSKIPLKGTHGVHDATRDLGQINEWWSAIPTANIGLRTGNTHDALDIDGQVGLWSLLQLYGEGQARKYLRGPMVKSPDGYHWFVAPTGSGNRAGFRPGLDYRGRGGFTVAPPSVLSAGQVYRWATEGQGMRARPRDPYDWLLSALEGLDDGAPPPPGARQLVLTDDKLVRLIERKADELRRAPVSRRNSVLNGTAYYLGRRIAASPHYEDVVRRELFDAAMYLSQSAPPDAPFTPREIVATLDSGLRAGMATPIAELGIAI